MEFPDTEDYMIELTGVDEELQYVIMNKVTGVWEFRSFCLPDTFSEMVALQTMLEAAREYFNNDVKLVPDSKAKDNGSVH